MPLTDLECKNAKPGKHHDGQGLFLVVRPGGKRVWWQRLRIPGMPATGMVIGSYPDWKPKQARDEAKAVRDQADAGLHPLQAKRREEQNLAAQAVQARAMAQAKRFGALADGWHDEMTKDHVWKTKTSEQVRGRLDNYLRPSSLWARPVDEITTAEVSTMLGSIYAKAPPTARKVRQVANGVFIWAIGKGLAKVNPVAPSVMGSGKQARKRARAKSRQPAVLDVLEAGEILRRTDTVDRTQDMAEALRLMALTVQRNANVVGMRWSDLDLKAATWAIPREDMKVDDPDRAEHIVPLPGQAVALLRTRFDARAKQVKAGKKVSPFVFATAAKAGHLTIEGPSKFYRQTLGLADVHVPHGWRATFSTNANRAVVMDDHGGAQRRFDARDVEAILDHAQQDESRAAYDRANALPAMRSVLQWWADLLDQAEQQAAARAVDGRPVPVTLDERDALDATTVDIEPLTQAERRALGRAR